MQAEPLDEHVCNVDINNYYKVLTSEAHRGKEWKEICAELEVYWNDARPRESAMAALMLQERLKSAQLGLPVDAEHKLALLSVVVNKFPRELRFSIPYWESAACDLGNMLRDRPRGLKTENLLESTKWCRVAADKLEDVALDMYVSARQNQALALDMLGRADEAVEIYTPLLERMEGERERFPKEWATITQNCALAKMHLKTGSSLYNYDEALDMFQSAQGTFDQYSMTYSSALCSKNLGICFMSRSRGNEAENLQEAVIAFECALNKLEGLAEEAHQAGQVVSSEVSTVSVFPIDRCLIYQRMASACVSQENPSEEMVAKAEKALMDGMSLVQPTEQTETWVSVVVDLVELKGRFGRGNEAMTLIDDAWSYSQVRESQVSAGKLHRAAGYVKASLEMFLEASAEYERSLALTEAGSERAEIEWNIALALMRAAEWREAGMHIEKSIAELTEARFDVNPQDGVHVQGKIFDRFARIHLAAVQIFTHLEEIEKAWRYGELGKAQAVAQTMESAAYTPLLSDEKLTEFRSVEKELRFLRAEHDSKAIFREVVPESEKERVRELTRIRDTLVSDSTSAFAGPGARSIDFMEIREEVLTPGEAILSWFVTDDYVIAFLMTGGSNGCISQVIREPVDDLMNVVNQWLTLPPDDPGIMRLLSEALHMRTVYEKVMESHVKALIISPNRFTHRIPFHSLPIRVDVGDGTFSVKMLSQATEHGISYVPSLKIFTLHRKMSRVGSHPNTNGLVSVACSRESAERGLTSLPFAAQESTCVTGLFPQESTALVDENAKVQDVLDLLRKKKPRYLHFACHGFFKNDDAHNSGLFLHDGVLRTADIMPLDLRGVEVVVLSACRTAQATIGAGDELVGLTTAFLVAGCRTVISSLWPVSDKASSELIGLFFQALLGSNIDDGSGSAAQGPGRITDTTSQSLSPAIVLHNIQNNSWVSPHVGMPEAVRNEERGIPVLCSTPENWVPYICTPSP